MGRAIKFVWCEYTPRLGINLHFHCIEISEKAASLGHIFITATSFCRRESLVYYEIVLPFSVVGIG